MITIFKTLARNFREFTQFFLIISLIIGCQPDIQVAPDDALVENIAYIKKQVLENWEKRSDKKNALVSIFFLEKAVTLEPNNTLLKLLLSRAYCFQGNYIESTPALKDSLFLKGAQIALHIVYESAGYNQGMNQTAGDSITRIMQAIAQVEKEYIDALYWCGANFSRYYSLQPVRKRVENSELIAALMHRVFALDPDYFYGGPNRFFGVYYARLPGVPLKQAEVYFQQAIDTFPNFLGTYVQRAEFLYTKTGDREKFRNDLLFVINADPAMLPEAMPENLFEQQLAKNLLARENLLFE